MGNQAAANLSALIESTDDLIWSVDLDYRLLAFNRAFQKAFQDTFGIRVETGMSREGLLPPERAVLFPPLYKRALSEGPFRTKYVTLDGRTLELSFNPIVTDGKATGVSVFGKNITKQNAAEESFRTAEKMYRAIFAGAVEGIYQTTLEGRPLTVNPAAVRMLGYDSLEDLLSTVKDAAHDVWVDPGERSRGARMLEEKGFLRGYECRFKRKDGTVIWVLQSVYNVQGPDGKTIYQGFIEDITERKQAEMQLRDSEELYRVAFQTSLDPFSLTRIGDGRFIDVNQAFLEVMGFEREEVIGSSILELRIWVDPRDRQAIVELLQQNSICRDVEARFRKKNGEVIWVLLSASTIEVKGAACILGVLRDLTEAKAAEARIRNLAFYDSLTGLPNRGLLLDRLQLASGSIRGKQKRALLYIDLDNFKMLNDAFGQEAGDLLLQEVARRLTACVRETDTVARMGSDEYVVMLEDLNSDYEVATTEARVLGDKILDAIDRPYNIDGHQCRSCASMGIVVFGSHPKDAKEILLQADIAMQKAKADGRNTMRFFTPNIQAAVHARAELERELHQAIETRQFELYYQPQMEQDCLTGAEALIRWNHPRHGVLLPDKFIPLAEETELILPLGNWVLETACAQIASWASRKEEGDLTIAINISAFQFCQPDFVARVLAAVERSGANPNKLRLELTESMLLENIEDVIVKMIELRSHGLRFSLDDFGTGYCSLAYLKRLPFDRLKIDRVFVQDILSDSTSGAIARTIISLGQIMGLAVIAEGVETEAQRDILRDLGCLAFQGFLFSPPLPVEDFQRLVAGFAGGAGSTPR